ncbi:transmembrane protein, putative [Bodo saltans]|uniref:Transmembrane protein, putative n=1 Tax=Bodo saltans TaxID=75058 RepID=A0A0S4KMP3_BODSA|nr:transmembrane protein, putative [Bodo saltans]|eukprot:CUI14145.1 transmembrane protein, putative [Bodo saltans]
MINSTITMHNVLNDQGAAIVVGNASNCAVTLLSSFFLQLPSAQLASSGANFAPVWMRNATDVTVWYGCLDVSKTGQYLVAPFNTTGVSFHRTTSCTPYSSGCSLGPSLSSSTSKPLSATFSFEQTRSLLSATPSLSLSHITRSSNTQSHASRTRTFSKSPTKSEDTMSRTSPHHSPTATASHTTKLAFIPTDLFASVDTVCPDAVIAVGLTAVTIPVQYVQTHTLWIRFNVSEEYASSLFSSPHDMSLTAQGDSLLTNTKPLLQNDVGNRCVWLRLGPIDYNPYEPRAFEFVVGPNPLIVSPLVGTINIQLIISPRTTTVAPAVSSGIATATGVVSLITMNTITSGSQSRAQMLLSLTACTYAADNEAYSFLGIGIGDVAAYYYRGAIVGNSLLVLLVLCVGLIVIFVVSLSSAKNKLSFWTDESFQAAGAKLFSTVHVPGLMMVPLTLLLQPTVSSSVALFMVGDGDAGDIILGIVGVAICLCALAYVSSTILFFRPPSQQLFVGVRPTGAPLDSDDEEKGGVKGQPHHRNPSPYYSSSRSRMSTIVDEWIVPPIHWVTVTPSAKAWKRRHLQMFCDNDTAWFTALGVISDFSVAVFNGIATGGNGSVCLVQLVVMTILYAVQGVLLVFNAPTLGRLAHVLISFSCTMSLFCAVLILAATATSDQASKTVCIDAANMLGTIINVAGLIQNMPLLVEAGLGVPRMLRRLWNARRTLERQRVPPMLHVMSLNDDMPTSTPDELLLSPQHGVHHNEMLDTEDAALEMVNQNSAAGGASPVVEQLTTTEQETPEAAQAPVPPPPKPSTEYFYNESLAGGLGPALRETEKAKQAMVLGDDGLNSGLDMLRTMRSNTDDDVIEL